MFVAINNSEMNVPQVLDWINRTKNANNNIISPEFAMEILGKTNFYGHIKTVLKNIKDRCKTKEDIEPYKEFILSCVDGREMSEQAMADLMAMAKLCGCKDEFDEVDEKLKFYDKNDCNNTKVFTSEDEMNSLFGKELKVYFDVDDVHIKDVSLYKVKAIKFKDKSSVKMHMVLFMPEHLDVSGCSKISIEGCDLKKYQKLKFGDGATVTLGNIGELPEHLDVSNCASVTMRHCKFSSIKNLKFRDGAKLCMSGIDSLPKDLDVSMCSYVEIKGSNLANLKELKFREGANVDLCSVENIPEHLDMSKCAKVDLYDCDLSKVKELKFGEGAIVTMSDIKGAPEVLDISLCSEFNYDKCNFDNVKTLKLKNRNQAVKLGISLDKFKGEIVYTEKNGANKGFWRNFGLRR